MCYYGNTLSKIQKYWNWLSANPNITWEIVKDNPDKPWDWCGLSYNLSENSNISWKIVEANPDKPWNWEYLSKNPFTKNLQQFIELKLKEHMMAFRI
jgi:hypothetical protein